MSEHFLYIATAVHARHQICKVGVSYDPVKRVESIQKSTPGLSWTLYRVYAGLPSTRTVELSAIWVARSQWFQHTSPKHAVVWGDQGVPYLIGASGASEIFACTPREMERIIQTALVTPSRRARRRCIQMHIISKMDADDPFTHLMMKQLDLLGGPIVLASIEE